MRRLTTVVAAALAVAIAGTAAIAEPKGPKGKGGAQTRYFDLSSGIFSELGSEAILKEVRQGTALVSAELDVCHLASPTSNRMDRFVVPLKIEGTRLIGTGQSQEAKQSVSVNLVRRALANGSYTFEGTVSSGSITEKVRTTDNTDVSDDEIAEQFLAETAIEEAPADFASVWPQSLVARVNRAGLTAFLEAIRGLNVRVVFNGLVTSCAVLRSGRHTVQLDVEAERAVAVLAKLKAVPGVAAAGFVANPPNMQRAVRFPSAGWRDADGALDREKFGAAVAAAMAKAMAATVSATSWDNTMGELMITLKRPDETVAGLTLTQTISITAVVAPESPGSRQRSILWIEGVTARILDDRPAPRLEFSQPASDEGEEGGSNEPAGSDELPDAVAAALKGVTWDSDKERWAQ